MPKIAKKIEFKYRRANLETVTLTGEQVFIKPFGEFTICDFEGMYRVTETKYGLLVGSGSRRGTALQNAKLALSRLSDYEEFHEARKFAFRRLVKFRLFLKYHSTLHAIYPNIRQMYSRDLGLDIIKFSETFYPEHAENDLSLNEMIVAQHGWKIAAIIKSIL